MRKLYSATLGVFLWRKFASYSAAHAVPFCPFITRMLSLLRYMSYLTSCPTPGMFPIHYHYRMWRRRKVKEQLYMIK